MKILIGSVFHISDYYGGNEHYTHYLAQELADQGHQVTYITGKVGKSAKYSYQLISTNLWYIGKNPVPSLDWHQVVTRLNPQVAHFTGSGYPLVSAALQFRYLKHIPTVLTFQAPTRPSNPLIKIPAAIEQKLMPVAFSAIVSTGPQNQKDLKSQFPHARIEMIPMMLADHFYKPLPERKAARKLKKLPQDRKIILFVGLLDANHYYKGFDVLIDAARELPPEYLIYAIGKCDPATGFQAKVKQLGLQDQITFAGFIDNKQLPSYFRAADVFVLPSTSNSEGFGLVLLEAMACGIPTITTTAIGSASWLAEHRVCTLVPPSDPHALAAAIKAAITRPSQPQLARSLKFINNFTAKRMADQTLQLYKSLLV